MRKYLTYLLILFFSCSCRNLPSDSPTIHDDVIREVVLHDLLRITANIPVSSYYIAVCSTDSAHRYVGYSDPSTGLLWHFLSEGYPVKKYTDAVVGTRVTDKYTGESGILFRVGTIEWLSSDRVSIPGSDKFGGLGADYFLYFLRASGTSWAIDTVVWIGSS